MIIKRLLVTIIISTLFTSISFAQKKILKNTKSITEQAENVMSALDKLDFEVAFSELKKNWHLPENELDQLESLTIKQFNSVSDRFGKTKGYEFITDLKINDFLLRKVYILKFKRHMIRVLFTYYNSGEGWIINSFKWDDTIDTLLK